MDIPSKKDMTRTRRMFSWRSPRSGESGQTTRILGRAASCCGRSAPSWKEPPEASLSAEAEVENYEEEVDEVDGEEGAEEEAWIVMMAVVAAAAV